MREIRLFTDRGKRFRFRREMSEKSAGQVVEAERMISSIIQPDVLAMHIGLFDQKFHNVQKLPSDVSGNWLFVRESTEYDYRSILDYFDDGTEVLIQKEAVPSQEWLRSVLNLSPVPGYYYGISSARVYASGCRISRSSNDSVLLYDRYNNSSQIALHAMNTGYWVFGPGKDFMMYPPIFYEVSTDFGFVNLTISVTWQNVWEDPDTEEYSWFKEVLQRLENQGWQSRRPV